MEMVQTAEMGCYRDQEKELQILREKVASQCAPVIFDVKPSNLLILESADEKQLQAMMRRMGLHCQLFYQTGAKSIWFVCRRDRMCALLQNPEVAAFFEEKKYRGIQEIPLEQVIDREGKRFAFHKKGRTEYPHELGLLLGYPLADVKGFIENKGKCYLCSGYWKVYKNEREAKQTFFLYRLAKQFAMELVRARVELWEIPQRLEGAAA